MELTLDQRQTQNLESFAGKKAAKGVWQRLDARKLALQRIGKSRAFHLASEVSFCKVTNNLSFGGLLGGCSALKDARRDFGLGPNGASCDVM